MKKLILFIGSVLLWAPSVYAQALHTLCKSVTPTITAGAYSSGQVIGSTMTFTNIMRTSVGSGFITSVEIADKAKQDVDLELEVFSSNPGTFTDMTTFAPSGAQLVKLRSAIPLAGASSRFDFSANSIHQAAPLSNPISTLPTYGNIWAVLVARGAYTGSSTGDITVTICMAQD